MGYMDKRPSRMQGQSHFSRSDKVGREHGHHLNSEGGVLGAGPNPRQIVI
jgi:hypothetical protein